jgi:hypothetical protein
MAWNWNFSRISNLGAFINYVTINGFEYVIGATKSRDLLCHPEGTSLVLSS